METTNCNFCGSSKTTKKFTLPDYLLERLSVTATLVQCNHCGLVYQNPRPTVDEIGQHYPDSYDPYDNGNENRKNLLLQKAIEYGIAKRVRFVTKHKKQGRILDIGCATGTFLNGVQSHGDWKLYGVEPSPYAAAIAKESTNAEVFVGTFEQAQFPEDYFDAVTMWDVLEHLHDPQTVLQEINRILKPDGILVIRVPNGASLQAKIFKQYWAGLDAPRHLYVFSPETLRNLFTKAELSVVDISFRFASYLIMVLSVRFWMVGQQINERRRERLLRILNHPISRLVTAPFFFVAGLLWNGPAMVVTARKTL